MARLIDLTAKGFVGTAFDGRYVYLVPRYNGAPHGSVARFDTRAAFDSASSWPTFDVATVNAGANGFSGAAFDGRYVYLAPYSNGDAPYSTGVPDGIVARFDTQAAFGSASFDVATVNAGAKGFRGAAFDGRYLYLVPNSNGAADGIVARFDAKSPAWLPKGWNASFF